MPDSQTGSAIYQYNKRVGNAHDFIPPFGYSLDMNSGLIQFLGKNSLPLYLIQVPMIKYGIFMGQWQNNVMGLIMTWAFIFIVSLVITRIRSLLDTGVRRVWQVIGNV